jgi:hypothetical protein
MGPPSKNTKAARRRLQKMIAHLNIKPTTKPAEGIDAHKHARMLQFASELASIFMITIVYCLVTKLHFS